MEQQQQQKHGEQHKRTVDPVRAASGGSVVTSSAKIFSFRGDLVKMNFLTEPSPRFFWFEMIFFSSGIFYVQQCFQYQSFVLKIILKQIQIILK